MRFRNKRLITTVAALLAALLVAAPALPATSALADEAAPEAVSYAADQQPELSAQAAFLFDRTTGYVLLDKNADERHYPASMTKIMTALVICEAGDLDRLAGREVVIGDRRRHQRRSAKLLDTRCSLIAVEARDQR